MLTATPADPVGEDGVPAGAVHQQPVPRLPQTHREDADTEEQVSLLLFNNLT